MNRRQICDHISKVGIVLMIIDHMLNYRLAHVNEKFGNTASIVASTSGTIITTSSFASTSAVLNAVVGGGNNNTTTIITTTESEEDDDHILKVLEY